MSLVTRKEFATMCGKPITTINTYVRRGKIIVRDKKIDTENAFNKLYFDSCHKPKVEKKPKVEEVYKEVVEVVAPIDYSAPEYGVTKKETAKQKRERKKQNAKDKEVVDWILRKQIADTLKAERQAELEQIKVDKLAGKLMPLELVNIILKECIHTVFTTFQNDNENLASQYCDILAMGDRSKLSEINQKISECLDISINKASEISSSKIKGAISDYSESRSRGERK